MPFKNDQVLILGYKHCIQKKLNFTEFLSVPLSLCMLSHGIIVPRLLFCKSKKHPIKRKKDVV